MKKRNVTVAYACLECKKVFKKYRYAQDVRDGKASFEYETFCPQCCSVMYETGSAFRAPKASKARLWAKLKPLFESGYKFNPDFGDPFRDPIVEKMAQRKAPESEFRKPARKRCKNHE